MRHDVFISYRREGGSELADLVRNALARRGYRAFVDVRELRAGPFDAALKQKIDAAADFVVLLTPGCLDRCVEESDWFRREIARALSGGRNVVPLRLARFEIPPAADLPKDIAQLSMHQCVTYSHEHSDAALDRLCKMLKSRARRRWPMAAAAAAILGAIAVAISFLWPAKPPPLQAGIDIHFQRADQRGSYQKLAADLLPLHTGDRIQVHARLSEPLAAYLVAMHSTGQMTILYPDAKTAEKAKPTKSISIPPEPDRWLPLTAPEGVETLLLLASREPVESLDKLKKDLAALGPPPSFDGVGLLVANDKGVRFMERTAVGRPFGVGVKEITVQEGILAGLTEQRDRWPVIRALSFTHAPQARSAPETQETQP